MAAPRRRSRAQAIEEVLEAGRRVSQAAVIYHSKVAELFGLGATDMKALDVIQTEGPMTPSDLADRMGFARPSVTAMIDRLETKQLLCRVPNPTDGRSLLVEFDPAAVSVLAPVYGPFFESLAEMVENYTIAELGLVARAFDDVATRQKVAADHLDSVATAKDEES